MSINPEAIDPKESPLLQQIHEQIDGCTKCGLCEGNTFYVPGVGTEQTDIMLVGEGPGKNEDLKGLPFVGAAGKFLDTLLESINLTRKDIYLTNVVKCRPPENRDPTTEEMEACDPYLEAQLMVVNPKIVVTLGRYSMAKFLPGVKISEVHGKPKKRQSDGLIIYPCYHPAVALYNGGMRGVLLEDFQRIPKLLSLIQK